MEARDHSAISRFLSEMKVQLIISLLSKCKPDWMQGPFEPVYSKIYYITEGEGRMSVGGEELRPRPGQLVFAPAGLTQSYSVTDPSRTYRMYWCHFTSSLSLMNLFSSFKLPFCLDAEQPEQVVEAFEKLVHSYTTEQGPAKSIRMQAALLNLISCYVEQAARTHPAHAPSLSGSKLNTVLQYIEARLERDLTVAELAGLIHHHPNYFIRFFKNHMGLTPMAYIYDRRLEKARQLLTSSDLSIGEIALAAGFNDIFHFSKAFKRKLGVPPSEFRSWPGALPQP